jgi:hypothetical protein
LSIVIQGAGKAVSIDWFMHHKGIMAASVIGMLAIAMILTVMVDARRSR